ncbi:MAG TPA: hypothetical protein DD727_05780 [Clostridiales bacterium]|nr:hypothetical protein [Clostridiales bacterium]
MSEEEAMQLKGKVPVKIYLASQDGQMLKLVVRYVPENEMQGDTAQKASKVLAKLLEGPLSGENLLSAVPGGTQALSPAVFADGVLTVNLSGDFLNLEKASNTTAENTVITDNTGKKLSTAASSTHVSVGYDSAAGLAIYSIVNSLTELQGVEKVGILIDGRTFAGEFGKFRLDLPFPRSETIISGVWTRTVLSDEVLE